MDASNWVDIERLFDQALDQPVGKREAWLKANCNEDTKMYQEVRAMLNAHSTAGGFLKESVIEFVPGLVEGMENEEDNTLQNVQKLGPYKIIKKLGYGGMGSVYLAEHSDKQIERQVALKVLRPGFDQKAS